jgi:hypothetical protein
MPWRAQQTMKENVNISFFHINIHALPGTTNLERTGQHIVLSYKRLQGVFTEVKKKSSSQV